MVNSVRFRGRTLGILAVLVMSTSVLAQTHSAVTPAPRDTESWIERFEQITERIEQGNVDLLFVGDSITHGWEGISARTGRPANGQAVWDEYYAPRNAASIGIGGDRTQHVLWRLDHGHVDGITPKAAVVMIGTNNSRDNSAEEIADGMVAIVEKLEEKLPSTKILLLAIFPRDEKPNERREMLALASRLAAERVVDGERIQYMDIGQAFLEDDGTLTADIMPDFLHPNENGYRIWAGAIEDKILELMEE